MIGSPCQETFGPSRLRWFGRTGTMASADFCSHEPGYPGRQALLTGTPSRPRANKNVNFRCTGSSSTLESVGNGFVVHGQLTSGSLSASMTFLFVASQLWREDVRVAIIRPGAYAHLRRLPPHGFLCRSCLRLVLRLNGYIWYAVLQFNSRFRTGDLHPTSSRPCWAYRWTRSRRSRRS